MDNIPDTPNCLTIIIYNNDTILGIGDVSYVAYIVGLDRNQTKMITTSFDDFIAKDNAVRVIDSDVGLLDLKELGFTEDSGTNKGQTHLLK